jgi:hypothetical protein
MYVFVGLGITAWFPFPKFQFQEVTVAFAVVVEAST